jgi:hypothetical protein
MTTTQQVTIEKAIKGRQVIPMDDATRTRIYNADQAAKTLAADTGLDLRVERSDRWAIWTVVCLNAGNRLLSGRTLPVSTANVAGNSDFGTVDGLRAALRYELLRPGVVPTPILPISGPATSAVTSERLIRRFLGHPQIVRARGIAMPAEPVEAVELFHPVEP